MDSALRYQSPVVWNGRPIRSWAAFHSVVKQPDRPLLAKLDDYTAPILVAGCQRSGTTALARLLKRADGVVDHEFGHDDELDGALLLAGHVTRPLEGRQCFQTTYLNDRYPEYFEHRDFRLIWMLREPRSVVYSMLYNWKRGALNRLFDACGAEVLARGQHEPPRFGATWLGPSRLTKACASYVAKTGQTFVLAERLGDRMAVVDYDELVAHKHELLPRLCEFVGVPYSPRLADALHDRSVNKRSRLGKRDGETVDRFCLDVYDRARAVRTIGAA
ncbi:MAG TPA: sulfotransferase domain-containing protein [Gammaproteobacteria bacterium]|nr:sulfotransferase domain-containing protein [Gammaproteobacteria bacterium]